MNSSQSNPLNDGIERHATQTQAALDALPLVPFGDNVRRNVALARAVLAIEHDLGTEIQGDEDKQAAELGDEDAEKRHVYEQGANPTQRRLCLKDATHQTIVDAVLLLKQDLPQTCAYGDPIFLFSYARSTAHPWCGSSLSESMRRAGSPRPRKRVALTFPMDGGALPSPRGWSACWVRSTDA